jgi:hypothetical protein
MHTDLGAVLDTALGSSAVEKLNKVISVPGLKEALANSSGKKKHAAKPQKEEPVKSMKKSQKTKKTATAKAPTTVPETATTTAPVPAPAPAPAPVLEKVATPPPAPAATPAKVLEVAVIPENDLLAGIMAAVDGTNAVQRMNKASEVLENVPAVRKFIGTVKDADGIHAFKLQYKTTKITREQWLAMGLVEMERELNRWMATGEDVKDILATIGAFKRGQASLVLPLWQLVREVIRKAEAVVTYQDLMKMLDGLVHDGWVCRRPNRGDIPKEGIMCSGCREYLVPSDLALAKVGWEYVKLAEEEAKKSQRQQDKDIRGLMAQATVEFFPTEDPADQPAGLLAFNTSPKQAALLEIKKTVSGPRVHIIESIGYGSEPLSDHLIKFDDGIGMWPRGTGGLYYSFQEWRRRIPAK